MQTEMEKRKTAGRPEAIIDWTKVGKYLQAQCSAVGIAGLFGISVDTLYVRCQKDNNIDFSAFAAQKKSEGKELLRAKMFEQAMGGDRTIQIWLSKQYLDMKDKQEMDLTTNLSALTDEQLIFISNTIIKKQNENH
jgi:hypothetical protein